MRRRHRGRARRARPRARHRAGRRRPRHPRRRPRGARTRPRYRAMEAYFDTAVAGGPHDDAQHRVDPGERRHREPADDVDARWRRAHDLGPVLTACFANSPFDASGDPRGWRSTRARGVARDRPARAPTPPAATRRAARDDVGALRARRARDDDPRRRRRTASPRASRMSFAQWIDDGHELGWPTVDDLAYHLTTLFPPVRPRGWLELRMIDALPEPWWPVAVAVTDRAARRPVAAERAACRRRAGARPLDRRGARRARTIPRSRVAAGGASPPRSTRSRGSAPTRRRSRATEEYFDRYVRAAAAARPTTGSTSGRGLHDRSGRPDVDRPEPEIVAALDDAPPPHARTCSRRCPTTTQRVQVSALMSPLVLGPRPHRPLRGAVARARARRAPSRPTPRFDDVYDAFKHPRRERPSLDILDPRGARDVRRRRARPRRSRCSTGSDLEPTATRCSPTGSSTAWSCSTSTSTTRRCSRPSS